MNRLRTVWPLPSNVVRKSEPLRPMGFQPAPLFQ